MKCHCLALILNQSFMLKTLDFGWNNNTLHNNVMGFRRDWEIFWFRQDWRKWLAQNSPGSREEQESEPRSKSFHVRYCCYTFTAEKTGLHRSYMTCLKSPSKLWPWRIPSLLFRITASGADMDVILQVITKELIPCKILHLSFSPSVTLPVL